DDGLIRNLIRQILQDSHGYLWLVTPSGLSRFDGYGFRNYGIEQDFYASNYWQMIEDRNGGYWVATIGSGLYRFKPEVVTRESASRFERYQLGTNPQSDFIYALCQDRSGKVWAGGSDGLFCLDEASGETAFRQVEMAAQGIDLVTVSAICEDREGGLWISSPGGLFRRLPDGRTVRYIFLPPDKREVGHLFFDKDGRLWMEHGNGLIVLMPEPAAEITGDVAIRFSSKNGRANKEEGGSLRLPASPGEARRFTQDDGFAGDDITTMCQTSDGKIWLGIYQKGLLLFDGTGFRLYGKEQGLSYYKVRSLAEDSEGNLWIGTDGGGLMKKIRGGFTAFSESDGIDETSIVFMLEDQSGGVCVATDLGSVGRFDGERFKQVKGQASDRLVKSVASDNARFYYANPVLKDRAGETWFSTGEGLHRFPRVQRFEQLAATPPKAVYTVANGLSGNNIYRTFEDSRGDIWVSVPDAQGGILSRWDRATGRFHSFGKDNGLVSSEGVTAICEDRQGDIWLGFGSRFSRGGVIARYRGGRFTFFSKEDGVPEGMVRDMLLDTAGRLWIASGKGGLARVDDPAAERPTFFRYTVENGLADNETNCLAEDQWQNIYVGMGRGLDRIDPATGRIRHYTGADGLTSTDVRKIMQDSERSFWIATAKGLYRFVPEQESHRPPPSVFITGLHIAGKQHPISELGEREIQGLEIEAGQNNLQVDFVSPSLGSAGTIRYECMLEGANQEWRSTGQRSIYYPGLPAGSYRFLVRAVGDDGSVSEMPARVSFTILRPVWQRWWFICLAIILTAVPALLVARYRRERIRAEREAELALRRSREERLA
ncbi:MAG TPA: two-component regulator propeller domain-containing protein, partial [Blastocatellia bacterium]|nr:two-component regulator propeller domain-containing protein [Blastocatellia bacterium]